MITWCPLPGAGVVLSSVTQMLPSRSTCTPCGMANSPAPNAFTRRPCASNLRIGATVESAHELPPQRSAIHTEEPSRSMSTPLTAPRVRPSGSCGQFRTSAYGLGRSFTGGAFCAAPLKVTSSAAQMIASIGTLSIMVRLIVATQAGETMTQMPEEIA